MLLNGIVWSNLTDMLLDMATVLIVMTVVMIWVIRTNMQAARRRAPPTPSPLPTGDPLPTSEPSMPDTLPPSPVSGDSAWK